jgi:hypothetical protein
MSLLDASCFSDITRLLLVITYHHHILLHLERKAHYVIIYNMHTSSQCRGCLLHTDPQERAKTTTASSDCRPRPTAPDRQEPESSVNVAKRLTQKRQQARYTPC